MSFCFAFYYLFLYLLYGCADLLLLVRQVGSQITEADVQILVRHFLTHKRGVIDAGSLLQAIRVKGVSS
jgi:hypothetical protein